jgi:hypothetical protein
MKRVDFNPLLTIYECDVDTIIYNEETKPVPKKKCFLLRIFNNLKKKIFKT